MNSLFTGAGQESSQSLVDDAFPLHNPAAVSDMLASGVLKVCPARHLHWSGQFHLRQDLGLLYLPQTASLANYSEVGDSLDVRWHQFPAETFVLIDETYVQSALLNGLPRPNGVPLVSIGNRPFLVAGVTVKLNGHDKAVQIRLGGSDEAVFRQVFVAEEYGSSFLPDRADCIVDLGANIGLTSVYFALRYPDARIISVEPDLNNFRILKMNTTDFGARMQAVNGAIWNRDCLLAVDKHDEAGRPLDQWGVRVSEEPASTDIVISAFAMNTIVRNFELPIIDILKIDIEGSEVELFQGARLEWLDRVKMVMVETHDRFRPGSNQLVEQALMRDFVEVEPSGELRIFKRR